MIAVVCVAVIVSGCMSGASDYVPDFLTFKKLKVVELSPEDLSEWLLIGVGEAVVDQKENALILGEGHASKGITLVSPHSYGNHVILSFEIRPMSYEGVSTVFLSASDLVTMGDLKVTDDHLGNFNFWTEGRVQNYLFSYHNGYFDSKPYIMKNPGLKEVATASDEIPAAKTFKVEVGRRGRRLWIKIDDKLVVKGRDKNRGGLPPGRIGFRLRGHGAGAYRCLIRNVVISEG